MWFVIEWQTGYVETWREYLETVSFVREMKQAVRRSGGRVIAVVRLKKNA